MGTIAAYFQSYLDFATVEGTVKDGGTWVLLAGPVLITLLGLYAVFNVVAAIVNGAKGTVRIAKRLAARPAQPATVTAVAAPVTIVRSAPVVLARSAA